MTPESIGLVASVGVNFVALYAAFRKERTAARAEDTAQHAAAARAEAEIEANVIARWKEFAAEMEAARTREQARTQGQIEQLARELTDARRERSECREESARQSERIEHLTADLRDLRAALKRAGIKAGGGDPEPVKDK